MSKESILYIAPFFERGVLKENSTYNVMGLSEDYDIVCRPIGAKNTDNPLISEMISKISNKKCDYLIIHSKPTDFCYHSGFKKCVGITHLKTNLIEDTNYRNYFGLMDSVYHDSSFVVDGLGNLEPFVNESEYKKSDKKNDGSFRFLIDGEPNVYEDIFKLVCAYIEEFRAEESVELSIRMPQHVNVNQFKEVLTPMIKGIRKGNNGVSANINFNNFWFEKTKLLEHYNEFDCIINCSLYNRWSRPVIDFGFLGKRSISLLDGLNISEAFAYGLSDNNDSPRGIHPSFSIRSIRTQLREAITKDTIFDTSKFTKQQLLSNFRKILL